jgi:transposase
MPEIFVSVKANKSSESCAEAQAILKYGVLKWYLPPIKVIKCLQSHNYSEHHVRAIIKEFNDCGLKALEPKPQPGRPTEFSEDDKAFIAETAKCPPDLLDCPFKRWSLEKLRQYLVKEKIISSISLETLRGILHEKKVKLRRIKTWKECNNPKLKSKKN